MAIHTTKSAFRKGLADAAPFILVMIRFASLFGILPPKQVNVFRNVAFRSWSFAGAGSLQPLQLMQEHAPTADRAGLCVAVNLRMAMYSAVVYTLTSGPRLCAGAAGWQPI